MFAQQLNMKHAPSLCIRWLVMFVLALTLVLGAPLAKATEQVESAPGASLGPPGTVFRYVETFGETGVAYLADNNHLYHPSGLGFDASGNLWVTESGGARVMQYTANGAFLMSIGTAGLSYLADETHFANPTDIAADSGANLWIADSEADRVVQLDPTGGYLSQLGVTWEEGSDDAHFAGASSLAFDSSGNIYVSDWGNHRVQIFDSSGVYSETLGQTGVSGTGNYQFDHPGQITIDDSDNLYVADLYNQRVQIFDASLTYSATLGKSGIPDWDIDSPRGVAVDANFIYVSDTDHHRVQIFNRSTGAHEDTLGEFGSGDYQFNNPHGVAVDSDGNLYIADSFNHRVQKYNSSLEYVRTFGVTGEPYLTDDYHYNQPNKVAVGADGDIAILEDEGRGHRLIVLDAAGESQLTIGVAGVGGSDNEHFSDARGVAFDADGNIYVGDCANHRVQIFTPGGVYSTTLGSYGQGEDQFDCPTGVAFDGSGNCYVADSGNQRIQIFDSSLVYSNTLGETGVLGDDNNHFAYPQGVAVDASGNIYVADTFNQRVQKFDSSLSHQMTLGVTGADCSSDFDHFCGPFGLAVDGTGNIYVAEQWGLRVQVFDTNGAYLTTIGGEWGDHPSQFRNLYGVAVDSQGNVYIPDMLNHRVQKFAPGVPDWQQVNINGFGERHAIGVTALEQFDNTLYAGTSTSWDSGMGAQIYRSSDGVTWGAITEPGFGVFTDTFSTIIDLAVFKGQLYAGAGWGNLHGQIWRSPDGAAWEPLTTDGFGDENNIAVSALTTFNGMLYAGVSNYNSGAQVWRSTSGDSGDWTQVAPDEAGTEDAYQVTCFAVFKGSLYAAVESSWEGPGTAQVWRSTNGSGWDTVVPDGFGDPNNLNTGGFAEFDGYLYLGTRNDVTGAQLWRSADGTTWERVVEDGFGDPNNYMLERLFVFASWLYAGIDNSETGLEIWRSTNGASWDQVNLDGFGDSNNNATLWNSAFAEYLEQFYLGTWNTANGGELWRFDLEERSIYMPVIQN